MPASLTLSVDCRDEVVKDVDELDSADNEQIDVDTIDDSTPPPAAAAADAPSPGIT